MKKWFYLLIFLVLPFCVKGQVVVSQPYKFQKWVRVSGSLFSDSTLLNSDSSTRVAVTAWVKRNFAPVGGGAFTNTLTFGIGFVSSSFNNSAPVTAKVDTGVIQTVLNLFPKADTRYLKLSTISGFANPSTTIGLTVNNGVLLTAQRSDATPALSQAIVPTWSGLHIFSAGLNASNIGVGTSPVGSVGVFINKTLTSTGNTAKGFQSLATYDSNTTSSGSSFYSSPATAAAAFTLLNSYGFVANGITIGAGSSVTNQFGFLVPNSLNTATNNYGFYGTLASASNVWNLYMAGTATNYLAGNTGIGTTTTTGLLNLGAGSTTIAPLIIASGTNLTTPLSGAIEYDGTNLYYTNNVPARKTIAINPMTATGDIIYSSSGSTPARLAIGGANTVLHGGTTPSYSAVANSDLSNSAITLNGTSTSLGGTFTVTKNNTDTTSTGFATKSLLTTYLTRLSLTETVQFTKGYVTYGNTQYARNSEGDVIVLTTGKYLCAYTRFNRTTADSDPATIVGRISIDSTGNNWGSEFVISTNIATQTVLSVSLIRTATNTIQCFFLVKNSSTDARVYKSTSTDDGITWPAAVSVINDGIYTGLVNASVRVANSSRIVMPIASTPDNSVGSPVYSVYDYYSDDSGGSWTKSGVIVTSPTMYEPSIVQITGNTLLMTLRPSAGEGFQYFSTSTDNGATWSAPTLSTLPSVAAPAKIINISGKLVALVDANTGSNIRTPLSIYKSLNSGTTWTKVADLESGNTTAYPSDAYPSLVTSNGSLLIGYWESLATSHISLKFTKILISSLSL